MEFLGILCLILITTTLAVLLVKSRNSCGNWAIASRDCVRSTMLNIVHQDVFVHDFSEIGVIMLMFIVGMECELNY